MSYLSKDDKQKYAKLIDDISSFSSKRNIVAHEFFLSSEDGNSVEFVIIKANGKLQFPDEKWTVADFSAHFSTMDGFYYELKSLTDKLGKSSVLRALEDIHSREPTRSLADLGLGGLLSPQPQGLLDSIPTPATSEKFDEKPPKPRRKSRLRKAP